MRTNVCFDSARIYICIRNEYKNATKVQQNLAELKLVHFRIDLGANEKTTDYFDITTWQLLRDVHSLHFFSSSDVLLP